MPIYHSNASKLTQTYTEPARPMHAKQLTHAVFIRWAVCPPTISIVSCDCWVLCQQKIVLQLTTASEYEHKHKYSIMLNLRRIGALVTWEKNLTTIYIDSYYVYTCKHTWKIQVRSGKRKKVQILDSCFGLLALISRVQHNLSLAFLGLSIVPAWEHWAIVAMLKLHRCNQV